MTAGEFLVSISGLPTGTALQHLLAIQARIGSGGDNYFSKFFVVAQETERTVVEPAAPLSGGALATRSTDSAAHPFRSIAKQFCMSRNPSVFVLMRSKTSN